MQTIFAKFWLLVQVDHSRVSLVDHQKVSLRRHQANGTHTSAYVSAMTGILRDSSSMHVRLVHICTSGSQALVLGTQLSASGGPATKQMAVQIVIKEKLIKMLSFFIYI